MSIFYCPKCGKFDKNFEYDSHAHKAAVVKNCLGYPIYHISCECGNHLAGYTNFKIKSIEDEKYIKSVIGLYYTQLTNDSDWYSSIKKDYEKGKFMNEI
jgi:hypothetical protein